MNRLKYYFFKYQPYVLGVVFFLAIFLVVHVAAGGVEQHRFRAEEPVAVARATQAGDPCAFSVGVGEGEAGLVEHGALA